MGLNDLNKRFGRQKMYNIESSFNMAQHYGKYIKGDFQRKTFGIYCKITLNDWTQEVNLSKLNIPSIVVVVVVNGFSCLQ